MKNKPEKKWKRIPMTASEKINNKAIVITNNPLVQETFGDKITIFFDGEQGYLDILLATRNYIHQGYLLRTHPLSGSIKPNETPYKSIIIQRSKGETSGAQMVDIDSLKLIEQAIMTTHKFFKNFSPRKWSEAKKEDFMLIDCDLITDSIEKSRS